MFSGEDSPEIRAALGREAHAECFECGGAGVVTVSESDGPIIGWANDNARRVLDMLGLDGSDPGVTGMLSLAEARRAVMRGRARNSRNVSQLTREATDGRIISPELNETDLRERVEKFAQFVEQAAERGATTIYWS